ncbi:MAG TPA: hypothetical protein VFJ94_14525 [Intrasporangium sp.]|uniref:hypothetical protein n=1 Tax=Intrasporangium sp. TaxID=1925024 RepID=UPI002D79C1DF|nr:hypothetical protein [Intrasporangium sp.]HET7399729.1 hypothetical protein [Intrasporangium sp.]
MNAGWITALATLITALSGVGVVWVKQRSEAKDPIPKAAAELAVAEQALGLIKESRDALREDVVRLKEERTEDRKRMDELQEQVYSLREDNADLHGVVDQMRHALSLATRYIEALLRWAREGSVPPQPTVPVSLRDLIDPTLQ